MFYFSEVLVSFSEQGNILGVYAPWGGMVNSGGGFLK